MAILAGFDVHRRQITFDALDTETGEVSRGRIDATPAAVCAWVWRFKGDVQVAVEACTGWLFVCDALVAAGATPHLAEPVETRALRGRKRRAKTDREDARWLRELLADGRLPEAWIPPEHVRSCPSRLLSVQGWWRPAHRNYAIAPSTEGSTAPTFDGPARRDAPPGAQAQYRLALTSMPVPGLPDTLHVGRVTIHQAMARCGLSARTSPRSLDGGRRMSNTWIRIVPQRRNGTRGRTAPATHGHAACAARGGVPGCAPPLMPPLPDDDHLKLDHVGVIRRGDHDLAVGLAEVVGPAVDRERADLVVVVEVLVVEGLVREREEP
jgi:Transposase